MYNKSKRTYQYVLTLREQMKPRKIADELSFAPGVFKNLVNIIDLQDATHMYGRTYWIEHEEGE